MTHDCQLETQAWSCFSDEAEASGADDNVSEQEFALLRSHVVCWCVLVSGF